MVAAGRGVGGGVFEAPGGPGQVRLTVEAAVRQVAPGRLDAYEALLAALAAGSVHMMLWSGVPGSPDAQYGSMRVAGTGYVPCASSEEQFAASGWARGHESVPGRRAAELLYRSRLGLWLDPHAPGGGVGVPWADLRRVALGLDRLPAGPLEISEPAVAADRFYALLAQGVQGTPAVRALYRAWVRPALGRPYLAIGVDLRDSAAPAVAAVRELVRRCLAAAPPDCPVALLGVADPYDPVALWLTGCSGPFWTG